MKNRLFCYVLIEQGMKYHFLDRFRAFLLLVKVAVRLPLREPIRRIVRIVMLLMPESEVNTLKAFCAHLVRCCHESMVNVIISSSIGREFASIYCTRFIISQEKCSENGTEKLIE